MEELKRFLKYSKTNGTILPAIMFLFLITMAIVDAVYSMVVFASVCLITLIIFSVKDFRFKRKNHYL